MKIASETLLVGENETMQISVSLMDMLDVKAKDIGLVHVPLQVLKSVKMSDLKSQPTTYDPDEIPSYTATEEAIKFAKQMDDTHVHKGVYCPSNGRFYFLK